MGLFGGSKASTTSTTTNVSNTTNNVDNRAGESGAVIGGNVTVNPGDVTGSLSITATDQGAVMAGTQVALESLSTIRNVVGDAQKTQQSQTSDLIGQAFGLASEARKSETAGAINVIVESLMGVAIVGIIGWALTRLK